MSLAIVLSQPLLLPTRPSHRPDWAGEGVVSSLVSALINNKFLYGFMKIGARKVKRFGGREREGKEGSRKESRTKTWVSYRNVIVRPMGRIRHSRHAPVSFRNLSSPLLSSLHQVLIDNAEKKGVAWRDNAEALLTDRRLPNTFSRCFGESHASTWNVLLISNRLS